VVYEVRASWEDAAVDHGVTRREAGVTARRGRWRPSRCGGPTRSPPSARPAPGYPGARIDPAKVTVIPNAVEVEQFHFGVEPDGELRGRLGLAGATVVGFAGSFYGYEGLDLLLEAVARLAVAVRNCACCWSAADHRKRHCGTRPGRWASRIG